MLEPSANFVTSEIVRVPSKPEAPIAPTTPPQGQETHDAILALQETMASKSEDPRAIIQEVADGPIGQEDREIFEQVKRPYTVRDVVLMQETMSAFERQRLADKDDFVLFGSSQFHDILVSGSISDAPTEAALARQNEPNPTTKDFEPFVLNAYRKWRNNILARADTVRQRGPQAADLV